MGSSAKRKKEKKKDFAKPKLKVGKTKPKAANYTDTSFKAKSITLNQQSLSTTAPSSTTLFTHQLSLCSSKSDSQRKDALSSLTHAITSSDTTQSSLPLPTSTILAKTQPLLVDGSRGVRDSFLKLLRALPVTEVAPHVERLLLYIHVGMTHLAAGIKSSSLDVLDWLLVACGPEVVGCAGGWVKTLLRFASLLGWDLRQKTTTTSTNGNTGALPAGQWTSGTGVSGKPGSSIDGKLRAKQLTSLVLFLETGLRTPPDLSESEAQVSARLFPICAHMEAHLLGTKSNPYGYLNLFGAPRDVEGEMYDDVEARKKVFRELLHETMAKGCHGAKKEGGEVGRAASAMDRVLQGVLDS